MLRKKNSEPAQPGKKRPETVFEAQLEKDHGGGVRGGGGRCGAAAQNQQKGRAGQHPVCGSSAGTA